jgi:hypothetical protein
MNYFCAEHSFAIGMVYLLELAMFLCWLRVFERRNDRQEASESLSLSDDITCIFKPPSLSTQIFGLFIEKKVSK